jgi:hypothetical protein
MSLVRPNHAQRPPHTHSLVPGVLCAVLCVCPCKRNFASTASLLPPAQNPNEPPNDVNSTLPPQLASFWLRRRRTTGVQRRSPQVLRAHTTPTVRPAPTVQKLGLFPTQVNSTNSSDSSDSVSQCVTSLESPGISLHTLTLRLVWPRRRSDGAPAVAQHLFHSSRRAEGRKVTTTCL